MAEGANLRVVLDSLDKARQYYEEKNYGRAFAHYLVVFQLLEPSERHQYEKEFCTILHLWGNILHQRGKYDDIFRCYRLATTYFPNSGEILNNLGVHAHKLKCHQLAKVYFEGSLSCDPQFLPAEQNLQSTRYALVERWHFPMLNDRVRNKAYAQAIFLEISHGFCRLLDVGTGTGLLSLFAAKSRQAKSITACDYSDIMYQMAGTVLRINNVTNIKLIKKKSTSLLIPQDMAKRANLLVTEILDSGVFGEQILETVIHAWENLLVPFPYGRVIPAKVELYICGIQSSEISMRNRYIPKTNNTLNLNNFCIYRDSEPYDTENMSRTKFKYMTDRKVCLLVDFHNVLHLKTIIETAEQNPVITLTCTENGQIDCYAVWFKLYLNESVTFANEPEGSQQMCWDQAIIHPRHPIPSIQDETLKLQMSCMDGRLQISRCDISKNILDIMKDHKSNCYQVTKDEIYFLNDNLFLSNLEKISLLLIEHFNSVNNLKVLDLTPFPVLGLLLSQAGAHVTCRVEDTTARQLRQQVCQANNINSNNIKLLDSMELNDSGSDDVEYDVVIQTLIGASGLLYETEMYQAQVLRYSLTDRGLYLPHAVSVWAELVQCPWLDNATKVDDSNVCGFKVAEVINEYKSTEQRDMNFNKVEYVSLSQPQEIGKLDFNVLEPHLIETELSVSHSGQANAVFYWFQLHLYKDICLTTRREQAFASNAAFMLDSAVPLEAGQTVCLTLKQHRGILKIFLSQNN